MRQLNIRNREDKKKKRNQVIVGLVLVFVMLSSILGFAFVSHSLGASGGANTGTSQNANQNSVNFDGFEFAEQNGFWILNKEGINYIFSYNPRQVPRISSEVKSLENYQNKTLYLLSEDALAESEIRTNLLQFTKDIEKIQEIGDCKDNHVIIREGNQGITQDNNCVFIEGGKEELLQLTDEFLFKLLDIKN